MALMRDKFSLRIYNASSLRHAYNNYDPYFSSHPTTKVYYMENAF